MSREIYQLKIAAKHLKIPVSRTILVPSSITFLNLHHIIVELFGFMGDHLFAFNYTNHYNTQISDGTGGTQNASKIKLFQLLGNIKRLDYTYDFGDNWEFIVILQKTENMDNSISYPQCIKWEGGMLLDDCGGEHIYQIITNWCRNKNTENELELLDIYENEIVFDIFADFDPDKFDLNSIRFRQTF